MAASLKEVEAIVDALAPSDQASLLAYLLPRVANAMRAGEGNRADGGSAWKEFRAVGQRLASTLNGQSITQAVSDMRR
jgi:hypothetical protein